jgi:organic hydroperoxide reductase OsmC/OhrA
MSEEGRFSLDLEHLEGYEFRVKFDWDDAADVILDEPAPLGGARGPNASRMLAAAAANCLSASLLFCVAKGDVPPDSVRTHATCRLVRNENKRLRIGGLEVRITVGDELAQAARMARCKDLFEDFCVVTASIRQGIPVSVDVVDEAGTLLHRGE